MTPEQYKALIEHAIIQHETRVKDVTEIVMTVLSDRGEYSFAEICEITSEDRFLVMSAIHRLEDEEKISISKDQNGLHIFKLSI